MESYSILKKRKNPFVTIGIHFSLILVSITCIFPVAWMISSSLKTQEMIFEDMGLIPKTFEISNYTKALIEGKFGIAFFNSCFYTVTVIIGVVLVSSLAAYAFSRLEFPGKNILFYGFLAYMMLPIPGIFLALYVLVNKLGDLTSFTIDLSFIGLSFLKDPINITIIGINTRLGFIMPQIAMNLSFAIYMLKTFFDKMPPELEEAARIDGCSKFGVYWHVALPLAKSALSVIVIFNALTIWNEFLWANLIFSDISRMPLPVALMKFQGSVVTQYPVLMAGMTITIIPIVILYLCMQKYIIKGI
ncbi:MAG: carbohydrate ABC transporter permease, partial [Candidatus Pacebacteria bacterium]|nr:carbohydrate ABC transporter permease [Candidatus Paceibacterota bacterium]